MLHQKKLKDLIENLNPRGSIHNGSQYYLIKKSDIKRISRTITPSPEVKSMLK